MPEDVQVAEPSAAPVTPAVEKKFSLDNYTFEQRREWRKTGNLPETNTAEPSAADPAADKSAKPQGQPSKKKNAADRTTEVEADIQKLEAALQRKTELKRQLTEDTGDKPGTPPASEKPAEKASPKEPVEPNVDDFKTWEEYQAADRKYNRDYAKFLADQAVERTLQAVEEKSTKKQQEAESKKTDDRWKEQIQKQSDAVGVDKWTEAIDAVKEFINRPGFAQGAELILGSEFGAQMLYALGTDEGKMAEIAALPPLRQIVELGKLEESLKPQKTAAATKKESQTPAPARNIQARTISPADPIQQAVADGDMRTYKRLMNEADRKKRRG